MEKLVLLFYILLSGTGVYAQMDSLTAWETGKAVADIAKVATGTESHPIAIAISAAAPFVFGWIWHITHLKKKQRKASKK